MGKLRGDIMVKCPDEFKSDLTDFIDDIEAMLNRAKAKMNIKSISNIGDIDTAFDIISKLSEDLY